MESNTRNYHAHGGGEWVVGGKLTFLPGAIVEGVEGLFDPPTAGAQQQVPNIQASEATTIATLREDFNRLLSALRTAGIMADATPADMADATPAE